MAYVIYLVGLGYLLIVGLARLVSYLNGQQVYLVSLGHLGYLLRRLTLLSYRLLNSPKLRPR